MMFGYAGSLGAAPVANLQTEASSEPTFFYPAVPDDAQSNTDQLVVEYRRTLGRERMWQLGVGALSLGWLVTYIRGQQKVPSRRRRHKQRFVTRT